MIFTFLQSSDLIRNTNNNENNYIQKVEGFVGDMKTCDFIISNTFNNCCVVPTRWDYEVTGC